MENKKDMKKTVIIIGIIFVLLIAAIIIFVLKGDDEQTNNGSNDPIGNDKFSVIDKTGDNCAEMILYFYEDENYRYYFECAKNYFVKVGDNEEISITQALQDKTVTITELEEEGLEFKKEAKIAE